MTYEEFADARLAPLLRYAVMLTGDPHQAEDLVQETMVRVQLNWRRVARADSPERYVRRMLTNQYVDWRRGSWMRRVLLRGEPTRRWRRSPTMPSPPWTATRSGPGWPGCRAGSGPRWCCATTRTCPTPRSPTSSAAPSAPSARPSPGRWPRSGRVRGGLLMIEDDLRAAFARHEPLTPADRSAARRHRPARHRRRRRRRRWRAGGVALALLGVLGIGAPLSPRTVRAATGRRSAARAGPDGCLAGALNMLLLGLDSDGSRPPLADSVLLVHIPADRSRPYLISLPRDLEVPIPGHGTDKLNAAFVFGAGHGRPDLTRGYELTRRTVADLTGVPVDAGVVLTYPALRTLTDAVDGVPVCLPDRCAPPTPGGSSQPAASASTAPRRSTCSASGEGCPRAARTGTTPPGSSPPAWRARPRNGTCAPTGTALRAARRRGAGSHRGTRPGNRAGPAPADPAVGNGRTGRAQPADHRADRAGPTPTPRPATHAGVPHRAPRGSARRVGGTPPGAGRRHPLTVGGGRGGDRVSGSRPRPR